MTICGYKFSNGVSDGKAGDSSYRIANYAPH